MISYNKGQHESIKNKTRTLVVDGNTMVRQLLTRLINREPDLGVCAEAENAEQALEAIEKEQVDLAIVDISLEGMNGIQLTEKIKSQYLHLPVLILTMHDEVLYSKGTSFQQGPREIENQDVTEQIVKAIHYARSLLKSQVFGFTLVVNLERSPQGGH